MIPHVAGVVQAELAVILAAAVLAASGMPLEQAVLQAKALAAMVLQRPEEVDHAF